eukprot:519274_1
MSQQHKEPADSHSHSHGVACSHNHDKEKEQTTEVEPKQLVNEQQEMVQQRLTEIESGLKLMEKTTKENICLVETEFDDLIEKLKERRDALMKQLNEMAADKKTMLCAQRDDLQQYHHQLNAEQEKTENKDIDLGLLKKDISLTTKPEILVDIDNNKLSQIISKMGDVNNQFPPNPPRITIADIKAHTCKVSFYAGRDKYDGFQSPSVYVVQIAFGPKKQLISDIDDEKEKESAFCKLKWKEIARKEHSSFIRIKKLKPATVYYIRVQCKNDYGWSSFCEPQKLETYVLKLNTKIMTSDEIEILIQLIKEKRKKKSIEWKLLFRGSDDGFLARTFHMKCDDIPNTVCVIESDHGNVFGGFTTLPWKSDVGRYHIDEEAFVFIVRKKKKALKKALMYLQYTSSQHSVVHNKYMGPVFGYGHDIYIRNKADKVDDNSCRNHTYKCSYAGELAGKEKFRVSNYEVFQISHPDS